MARGYGTERGVDASDRMSVSSDRPITRTIAFRYKCNVVNTGGNCVILEWIDTSFNTVLVYFNVGFLYIDGGNGGGRWYWAHDFADDETDFRSFVITHTAGANPSDPPVLYVNGVSKTISELNPSSGPDAQADTPHTLRIGNNFNSTSNLDGDLAELAIASSIWDSTARTAYDNGVVATILANADVYYCRMNDDPVTAQVGSNPTVTGTAQTTHPTMIEGGRAGGDKLVNAPLLRGLAR